MSNGVLAGTNRLLSALTRRRSDAAKRIAVRWCGTRVVARSLHRCTGGDAGAVEAAVTKLVLLDVSNIDSPEAAPRKQVVTDFMAENPDVTIDVRALPSNVQWDRVARTTVSSGEQVDLLNVNGLRPWC